MIWVYSTKQKPKVFGIFKMFKALVEKQSDEHINVLRSDRGKKHNLKEFDKFCQDKGIE